MTRGAKIINHSNNTNNVGKQMWQVVLYAANVYEEKILTACNRPMDCLQSLNVAQHTSLVY